MCRSTICPRDFRVHLKTWDKTQGAQRLLQGPRDTQPPSPASLPWATLAFLLFLQLGRVHPTPGPLHLLFLLQGALFPSTFLGWSSHFLQGWPFLTTHLNPQLSLCPP